MKITRTTLLGSLAVALLMAASYRVGRARADGAPTMNPLTYGGFLDDGGRPVDGTRSITVRLWDAASGGTAACTTVSPTTTVSAGRWRVALDAACATAVQMTPNLWAEVIVDSTTFPRAKVRAVPFALEAGRAAGASGPLAARLSEVESTVRRQILVGTLGSSSSVPCSVDTFLTATSTTPLVVTPSRDSIFRISVLLTIGLSTSGFASGRITGSPSPMFLSQPEFRWSGAGNRPGKVEAIVRLDPGRAYTFSLEYKGTNNGTPCYAPFEPLSPLTAEQLN